MLEEGGVLGGEHGADDVGGDPVERRRSDLAQIGSVVGGEQRRFEIGLGHPAAVELERHQTAGALARAFRSALGLA